MNDYVINKDLLGKRTKEEKERMRNTNDDSIACSSNFLTLFAFCI